MKKFLTILTLALVLALFITGMLPAFAVQESVYEEGDTYVVSDDTDYVTGPPMPAPEPPEPIAPPIPPEPIAPPEPVPPEEDHTPPGTTPRPEWYPMPDAVWRPKPEPIIMGAPLPEPTPPTWEPPEEEPIIWCNPPEEEGPIIWCNPPEEEGPIVISVNEDGTAIIAVKRVLPCPPEPIKDPSKGVQIEPNDDMGPGPNGNVGGFSRPIAPEPTPPPWEPEEEPDDDIFVAALPPKEDVDRGCIIYCTLDVDTISITVDSINDIDPKLFVCDTISCRAEVVEPKAHGYFEVERPRGTRLFLAVFDSEGVMFHITVWTPPLP